MKRMRVVTRDFWIASTVSCNDVVDTGAVKTALVTTAVRARIKGKVHRLVDGSGERITGRPPRRATGADIVRVSDIRLYRRRPPRAMLALALAPSKRKLPASRR